MRFMFQSSFESSSPNDNAVMALKKVEQTFVPMSVSILFRVKFPQL